VEVGDDHLDREEGSRHSTCGHGCTCGPSSARDRVPDAEAGDHQSDLLFAQDGGGGTRCEGCKSILVEVVEGEEEQWAGEGNWVELVECQPLSGGIEEVGEGEAEGGSLRAEMPAGEPEDGERSERDCRCLHDEQQVGVRPDQPERGKRGQYRIEVRGQPRDLLPLEVGGREEASVGRRPHGLNHVAEVEAACLEGPVAQDGQSRESGHPGCDPDPQQHTRLHRSCSSSARHCLPSTCSFAWARYAPRPPSESRRASIGSAASR
jgi:hypothetical protein